uniref:Acid phosphatase n=1 Tax=Globodera rostochiensis TaxID=31243 RepID=A0A914GSU3_GLORO
MLTFFASSPVLICLFWCNVLADLSQPDKELVLLQSLWRHGDRSPTGTFKTDIYQEDFWPQGWGQLSPRGMSQQVVLGKKLRKRYVEELKYVGGSYNSHELYVRATDVNRTLISAISNFIGFYGKGRPDQDYPNENDWPTGFVPIAIHTIDGKADFIAPSETMCPRYGELSELMRQTVEYENALHKYSSLLEFLSDKTQRKTNLFDVWLFQDTFFVEKDNNLTLVDWAEGNEVLLGQIKELVDTLVKWQSGIGLQPFDGVDFSVEIPRIRGGTILWTMVGNMLNKIACEKRLNSAGEQDREIPGLKSPLGAPLCQWMKRMKYLAYSAHDTTVASLFSTFGFQKTNYDVDGYPHYTACVTVELWRDKNIGQYSVNVLYWKPNEESFIDITKDIKGCEYGCTLKQFVNRSEAYRMDPTPEEYCRRPLFPKPTTVMPPTTSTVQPNTTTTSSATTENATTTPAIGGAAVRSTNPTAILMLLLLFTLAVFWKMLRR